MLLSSSARTGPMVSAPLVTAARPMRLPTSMWSGPISNSQPWSGRPPSMTYWLVPTPSMPAPIAFRQRARSCTCGSAAALRSTVRPRAATAPIRAFSVPVTLGSSRKMSAPVRCFASIASRPPTSTAAPSASSARMWVSTRRRPITSPPGGGSTAFPIRASNGAAKRIEARIRELRAGSSGLLVATRASTVSALGPVQAISAPSSASRAAIASTSRIRGTLPSATGPSARSVAARMGRAAFLLPAGRTDPLSGRPPCTWNRDGMAQTSPEAPPRVKRTPMYVWSMVTTSAGWVGPTGAIALVVIALAFALIAAVAILLARGAASEVRELSAEMARLRSELSPALRALQRVADAGADLSSDVKDEVHQYLATSRVLRKDLEHGVRRLKTRLADLDALYEVVHGEVQDTALDVASRLRTVRKGVRVVSRLRRMLVRTRR